MVLPLNNFGTMMGNTGNYRSFVQNKQKNAQKTIDSTKSQSRPGGTIQAPYTIDQRLEAVRSRTAPKKEQARQQYIQGQSANATGATSPTPVQSSPREQFLTSAVGQPSPIQGIATTPSGAKVDTRTGQTTAAPQRPADQGYRDAYEAYIRSLSSTPEEQQARQYLNKLVSDSREAYEKAIAGGDTLGFALGQGAEAQRGFARPIEAAEAALSGLTGERTARNEAARLRAEFEKGMLPEPGEGFTLKPGELRYDSQGNLVAGSGGGADFGVSPEAQSWATLIASGQAKLSDVPSDIRSQVASAVSQQPAQQTPAQIRATDQANVAISNIDSVLSELEGRELGTGTAIGRLAGQLIPGSEAVDLAQSVETVKALIGFDQLQKMREASPTGGALGQVSERELAYLQSVAGSLNLAQSTEKLVETLSSIRDSFARLRAISNPTLTPEEYEQQFPDATVEEIAEYIRLQEGGGFRGVGNTSASNRPQRNNNPGNVKSGGLADSLAIGTDDQGHLIFPDPETGFMALQQDLQAKIQGRSQFLPPNPTLAQLGSVYAEDPNWSASVARILGVPVNTRAGQVDFNRLVQAIARQEGFYA